jgi:hypothetical protein
VYVPHLGLYGNKYLPPASLEPQRTQRRNILFSAERAEKRMPLSLNKREGNKFIIYTKCIKLLFENSRMDCIFFFCPLNRKEKFSDLSVSAVN